MSIKYGTFGILRAMEELVKVKCPRCDEVVRCYMPNEKRLLFKFGLTKVLCPRCKQDLTNLTHLEEPFFELLLGSSLGKALILITISLIFVLFMVLI
jgi:phage FluMu protein Com